MKLETFAYPLVNLIVLLIGLPLIGVRHWVWIALGIAIAEFVPTIGTTLCMTIWAFCALTVTQNTREALWLMGLYSIIMILHQIMSPFLKRPNLFGATPFEMLLSCAVGYLITGFQPFGILVGPLVYLFGKKLILTFFEPRKGKSHLQGYFNRGFPTRN